MKGAVPVVVITVLVLSALSTSHPYYPSPRLNGNSVDMQSGKDLPRRPLASWQEYAAGLMQGKKPTDPPADPRPTDTLMCVEGGTSSSLQKAQLEMILDTVYPVTGNPIPFINIITPDHGTTVYTDELSHLSAYQEMLEEISEIDNIWNSYSPCPSCARALLDYFDKPDVEKPTIHIARIYSETSKLTHIVESFQCLAKLVHDGFALVPWDFNQFKTRDGVPAFVDACTSVIETHYRDGNFTSAYMELVSQLTFIQELGQNPHANSWCAP